MYHRKPRTFFIAFSQLAVLIDFSEECRLRSRAIRGQIGHRHPHARRLDRRETAGGAVGKTWSSGQVIAPEEGAGQDRTDQSGRTVGVDCPGGGQGGGRLGIVMAMKPRRKLPSLICRIATGRTRASAACAMFNRFWASGSHFKGSILEIPSGLGSKPWPVNGTPFRPSGRLVKLVY